MMRLKYIFLILLFSCMATFAQENLSLQEKLNFSGYYENRFFPQEIKDEFIFLDYNKLRLNIRVGKQQLPWGTGYAWNPTDIFNAKDILDPLNLVGYFPFGKKETEYGEFGMGGFARIRIIFIRGFPKVSESSFIFIFIRLTQNFFDCDVFTNVAGHFFHIGIYRKCFLAGAPACRTNFACFAGVLPCLYLS